MPNSIDLIGLNVNLSYFSIHVFNSPDIPLLFDLPLRTLEWKYVLGILVNYDKYKIIELALMHGLNIGQHVLRVGTLSVGLCYVQM